MNLVQKHWKIFIVLPIILAASQNSNAQDSKCPDLPQYEKRISDDVQSCLDNNSEAKCLSGESKCIRWNKDGSKCYESTNICTSPNCAHYRIYCNFIIWNKENNASIDVNFNANYVDKNDTKTFVRKESFKVEPGYGNSISWFYDVDADKLGKCDYDGLQIKPICKNNSAQLADSPWSMFHGSAQHGGQSKYDTSHVDGTIKWTFEADGAIESSPIIDKNGVIYFGAHDGYLYALNPDGTLKWKFNAGPSVYDKRWNVTKSIMAAPAIAKDGTIYIYSSANYLFAVNPDGTEKWRFPVKWGNDFWSSPTVGEDGTIYIGSARVENDPGYKGGVFAINPDGTEKWFFEDSSGITSTAAIGLDGTIYIGGNDLRPDGKEGNIGALLALNQQGKLIWKFSFEDWMESSPAIGKDGTIYTSTGREARFYAFNPDGTVKWKFQADTGTSATPAIGKYRTVFVGAWDTYMYAFDTDGTKKWSFKTPDAFEGIISSAAIGADGTIYFGSNSGIFYALYSNGTKKWHYDIKSSIPGSPAIGSDGTVYVGAWNKKLYAFGGAPQEMEKSEEVLTPPEAARPEFKEEVRKEEPKEEPQERSEGIQKNVFQKIWETIINFFKRIFRLK